MNTLSEDYRTQQQELHKNKKYGTASIGFAGVVKDIYDNNQCLSISDYGAGKKNLLVTLSGMGLSLDDSSYYPYDPAFPEYGVPKAADLVCCIDVLEHIEPEYLENVLTDLKSIVIKIGFFTIHTGPAKKVLSDGRNAHLIQMPVNYWVSKLSDFFSINSVHDIENGVLVIVTPLNDSSVIKFNLDNLSKLKKKKSRVKLFKGWLKRMIRSIYK